MAWTSIGCGPQVIPGDGDGSGASGSQGGPASTGSGSASVTSGWPATTLADDGTEDDEDDADDGLPWDCGVAPPGAERHCIGPGQGDSICDPQPILTTAGSITVDGGALPSEDPGSESYTYTCTIADWADDGLGWLTLGLACADGEHTLEIESSVAISFDATGDFLLSVIHGVSPKGGGESLVALRRADGELVLAGATGSRPPDHDDVPTGFFEPLDVMLVAEACNVEPPGSEGSGFITGCYAQQRQALRFALQGRAIHVYDRGQAELSPYALVVQHAEQRHDLACSDLPDRWYSWIAVTQGSG